MLLEQNSSNDPFYGETRYEGYAPSHPVKLNHQCGIISIANRDFIFGTELAPNTNSRFSLFDPKDNSPLDYRVAHLRLNYHGGQRAGCANIFDTYYPREYRTDIDDTHPLHGDGTSYVVCRDEQSEEYGTYVAAYWNLNVHLLITQADLERLGFDRYHLLRPYPKTLVETVLLQKYPNRHLRNWQAMRHGRKNLAQAIMPEAFDQKVYMNARAFNRDVYRTISRNVGIWY